MKRILSTSILALAVAALSVAQAQTNASSAADTSTGLVIQDGEKIAFLGDSITQFGGDLPGGYVQLVISGLKANGVTAVPIRAGVSGHKSDQMLARLESSVLSKKPDWMTLSCGVNDVMHGANGIPLEPYKENIRAIVDQTQAAGIKVMILTATMIGEDAGNEKNAKLAAYNEFLRELAEEKQCELADLNAAMQAELKPDVKGSQLTRDGVHMNPFGDQMMAIGVLREFGLDESQLQIARAYWMNMPEVACKVTGKAGLTLRQYQELSALAVKRNCSVEELINAELTRKLDELLPAAPAQ